MSAGLLFSFVIGYFVLLLIVAWYTSRNSNNDSFFIGNRNSNWILVAFGMIGTSLSGVTFVSVPGAVGKPFGAGYEGFTYFQIVIGYIIGYFIIAYVLLPLYYRLNLTSIYSYLNTRLGFVSYKTGSSFFILSRTLGATARLYLVVKILQDSILSSFGMPFWLTTLIILLMILLYTFEGGVKTIVWTDTLQTTCMLAGLIICVIYILQAMNLSFGEGLAAMKESKLTDIFVWDPSSRLFFVKQILAGAFITITMTGMDQEMMQKNISVKNLSDSRKNMLTFSFIQGGVVLLFLFLGGLLYLYAGTNGVNVPPDKLFPTIALGSGMPPVISVIFIIALISALFPSADGAITALTSSFCIDILGMKRRADWDEKKQSKTRKSVHLIFAAVFLLFVMIFKAVDSPSMITVILKVAGYTYGPLLGLFIFGIITKRSVNDKLVPAIAIAAPLLCLVIDYNQKSLFGGFEIGLELIIINGLLTFIGLWMISKKQQPVAQ
ncbi:sodium:solute symporter [Terrimonas sp. NA20]|uniref:Sodium:solute symporter n=1 Tax=Terrimonas ginsenosidimutans TaxID=2908004 RepID=A0ABS9KVS2_9BACT|nr:sodium:solute symporter [Terrimonas ginsenosidimutans]MCG2616405.1 sodium:solute symporter [Terrimonas ginsenosidimutans]